VNTTDPIRLAEVRLVRAHWHPDQSQSLLTAAIRFARVAYDGLTDEAGHPAIDHPLRVTAALDSDDAKIVAVLHDTFLNTVTMMRELRAFLPDRLIMAVAAFEHSEDGINGISLQLISSDSLARQVKLACIADLSATVRLAELDPFTRRRREKEYATARQSLGPAIPAGILDRQ
jgi:(p)ppGpp synthase/HD superfamily hydrolase